MILILLTDKQAQGLSSILLKSNAKSDNEKEVRENVLQILKEKLTAKTEKPYSNY